METTRREFVLPAAALGAASARAPSLLAQGERKTGSRVRVTECLTIAEREERAKISQAMARDQQRVMCSPGETSSCGR